MNYVKNERLLPVYKRGRSDEPYSCDEMCDAMYRELTEFSFPYYESILAPNLPYSLIQSLGPLKYMLDTSDDVSVLLRFLNRTPPAILRHNPIRPSDDEKIRSLYFINNVILRAELLASADLITVFSVEKSILEAIIQADQDPHLTEILTVLQTPGKTCNTREWCCTSRVNNYTQTGNMSNKDLLKFLHTLAGSEECPFTSRVCPFTSRVNHIIHSELVRDVFATLVRYGINPSLKVEGQIWQHEFRTRFDRIHPPQRTMELQHLAYIQEMLRIYLK